MSARIYELPGAAAEPVHNPKKTCGRWPKGVRSLASARQVRDSQQPAAKEAERSAALRADAAEQMEPLEVPTDLEALGQQVQALHRAALRLSAQMFLLGKEI